MADAGRAPRSIAYVLSVIRQVYNFARRNDSYSREWSGADKAVKISRKDNRRQRFLSHENISMTERYSHLSPDTLQDAVRTLEKGITGADKEDAGHVVAFTQ